MERIGLESGEEINDLTEVDINKILKEEWGKDAFEKTEEIVKQSTKPKTREMVRKLAFVPINLIIPNIEQPRFILFETEEEFRDMVNSIKVHGNIKRPIIVLPYKKSFMLKDGQRRLETAKAAGVKKIYSIIEYEVDESGRPVSVPISELLEDAIITNQHQRKMTAVEEALAYQRLMDLTDSSQAELAVRLGKKSSDIAISLKLLKLDNRILKDLMVGKISRVLAQNLASFPKDKQDIMKNEYNEILNGFGGKIPSSNPSEWVAKTLRRIAQKMGIELLKPKRGKIREFADMVFDSTNRSIKRFNQLLDDLGAVKVEDIKTQSEATREIIASLERLAENIEDTCVKLKGRLDK